MAALVFIYLARFNFKFRLHFKSESRLPLFYLLMVVWCCIEFFINGNFASNYILVFCSCASVWAICLLAMHQVKLAIEKNGVEKVERSLRIFFVANALASVLNVLMICFETNNINPYTYEDLSYKYFTSTGDYVRGITFDVCTTNMIINAMGIFYFLQQKRNIFSVMCLCVALLTTSNLGNLILIALITFAFFTHKNKVYKSMLLCCISILVLFMVKISPANLEYFIGSFKKINKHQETTAGIVSIKPKDLNADSLIRIYVALKNFRQNPPDTLTKKISEEISSINEIRRKIRSKKEVLKPDIDFDNYTKNMHGMMIGYSRTVYGDSVIASVVPFMNSPKSLGKLVSMFQTGAFLKQDVKHFLLGAGPGNFSSKFTFRALGLNTDGQWPQKYTYMSEDFKNNHLKLWLYYQLQPPATHSTLNSPNSVANQLTGEYGLIGLLLFLIFYVWYFFKQYKFLSYGRIIFPLMMAFLFTDYWFENLSVMIIFETLILLDLHKKEAKTA